MSKIVCDTMAEFISVIAGLAEKGIVFKAYTHDLSIEITGY